MATKKKVSAKAPAKAVAVEEETQTTDVATTSQAQLEVRKPAVSLDIIRVITENPMAAYAEPDVFEQLQRGAKMLAASDLTPKAFQGKMANCFGAMIVAARMRLTPWEIMQSLYVVHGKMGWEAKFLIARMKATGVYSVLDWEESGVPMDDDWAMRYVGVRRELVHGEKIVTKGSWVSYGMAKAAGWTTKADSYWKKEPDLMLRYRSATRFANLHHPDATLGFMTREELIDVGPTEDDKAQAQDIASVLREAAGNEGPAVIEGEAREIQAGDEVDQSTRAWLDDYDGDGAGV